MAEVTQQPLRVLYEDAFLTLSLEEARRIVRYQRSDVVFTSAEEIANTHDQVDAAVRGLDRATHGLLVDLRKAQRGESRSLRSSAQTTLVEQAMASER